MPSIALGLDHVRQDLAYAVRSLRRSPGFAITVVATLALGVGANAALFSLADRLFLQTPEGVVDPGSLRRFYARSDWSLGNSLVIRDEFEYPQYLAVSHAVASRAQTAAYTPPDSLRVGTNAPPARGVYTSADFFPLLGVHTVLGRVFAPEEDRMGTGALVAVISYAYWHHHFAGDSSIIGRVVPIARQQYTIIGVLRRGFTGIDLEPVDVWLPLATYPSPELGSTPWYESWRGPWDLRVITRARPGTPNDWLSAAATTAYDRGEIANVSRGADSATLLLGPIQRAAGPAIPPRTDVAITTRLVGVALIVLLVACANVTNLLFARAHRRRREIAVRLAIGISRSRLAGQFLTEGVVLAAVAAPVALLAGLWGAVALRRAVLAAAEAGGAVLDWRIMAVAMSVALAAGLLASLTPALRASRPDLTTALRSGAREGGDIAQSRFRASLVVAQVALSVVLLAGAGVFVRSFDSARAIDIGFDADHLVYASVYFADPKGHFVDYYARRHMAEVSNGLGQVALRMRRQPGVEATALATAGPMRGFMMPRLYLAGGRMVPNIAGNGATLITATPDYFPTTGVRLERGRVFDETDNAGAEPVAVVNETAAKAYWPGRDPLGQCIMLDSAGAPCMRVIGVTHDAHLWALVEKPMANVIAPATQQSGKGMYALPSFLIVRAAPREIGTVTATLRGELRNEFPTAEPPWIRASATDVRDGLAPWRLGASLFSVFGALALLVAAIGVYSVRAYSVSQRTHEMGVRMALGARNEQVMSLVIREGVRVVLGGIVVGVAVSLALGRLVASMLYDTSPRDPVVLVVVALLLATVSVAASAVPAWRASRTDPVVALRAD